MRSIVLTLSCLLGAMPALAVEPKSAEPNTTTDGYEIVFEPSQKSLIQALNSSRIVETNGSVLVAYDENGSVLGVKLEKSTGSVGLDAEIMAWAAQVKLKVPSSGVTQIPFHFVSR